MLIDADNELYSRYIYSAKFLCNEHGMRNITGEQVVDFSAPLYKENPSHEQLKKIVSEVEYDLQTLRFLPLNKVLMWARQTGNAPIGFTQRELKVELESTNKFSFADEPKEQYQRMADALSNYELIRDGAGLWPNLFWIRYS